MIKTKGDKIILLVLILMVLIPLIKSLYFEINKVQITGIVDSVKKMSHDDDEFYSAKVLYYINGDSRSINCDYSTTIDIKEGYEEILYYNKKNTNEVICTKPYFTKPTDPVAMLGVLSLFAIGNIVLVSKKLSKKKEFIIYLISLLIFIGISYLLHYLISNNILVTSLFRLLEWTFILLAAMIFICFLLSLLINLRDKLTKK